MTEESLMIPLEEAEELVFGEMYLAMQEESKHRWYTTQLVVFLHDAGRGEELYGLYYLEPASELQEDAERFEDDPVPIFRVRSRTVIQQVYERET